MQILITGRGLELTQPIESYINKKINGLDKFFDGIIRADVVVAMETHHHNKGQIFFAECKLEVPGYDVFIKKEAGGVYEAVDILRDHLETDLKKHKAKLKGNEKKIKRARRDNKEYVPE